MSNAISMDDVRIEEAQVIRHDLVANLLTDSNGVRQLPTDGDTIDSIRQLLKDSDSSVFTKKRLTVEESAAENDKIAAEILSVISKQIGAPKRINDPIEGECINAPVGSELVIPDFDITDASLQLITKDINVDDIISVERRKRKGDPV